MRRITAVAGLAAGLLLVAQPASAFAHNRVHDPYLHAVLDTLTLAVVAAPLITARLWGPRRRGLLLVLVTVVQVPVAVAGFVPITNPALHLVALVTALALTATSLWLIRQSAGQPADAAATEG